MTLYVILHHKIIKYISYKFAAWVKTTTCNNKDPSNAIANIKMKLEFFILFVI